MTADQPTLFDVIWVTLIFGCYILAYLAICGPLYVAERIGYKLRRNK